MAARSVILDMERQVLEIAGRIGVGAQFGGKYFAHDARVIRLPRHGASCPVGLGVSCSADRQALAKIKREGVFLEQLEEHPAKYLPEVTEAELDGDVVPDRTRSSDEGDPRGVEQVPGGHAVVAHGHNGGGTRHRAQLS